MSENDVILEHEQHAIREGLHRTPDEQPIALDVQAGVESSPAIRCGLFLAHQSLRSAPKTTLGKQAAEAMVRAGQAKWVNRKKGIQMVDRGPSGLRGQSCVMGPNVAERAAEGSYYHQTIVNAWAPQPGGKG